MALDNNASLILKQGYTRIRVRRAGILQFQVFKVKRVALGSETFVELFLDRLLDMSEMLRVANETGLPVESENRRVFPEGKGAKDFAGL
jgi:hypothetical protein